MAPRFLGRYEHSLDSKGRVVLPAKFRSHFGTVAYLTENLDGCVAIWTAEGFEKEVARMEAVQEAGDGGRQEARVWSANAQEVDIDGQGRVAVPPFLRSFAGLDGAVLVTGALDRVEIWSQEAWDTKVQPAEESIRNPELRAAAPVTVPAGPADATTEPGA